MIIFHEKSRYFFSIIIPIYNNEIIQKFALKSAANQTFKNFEVLLINNYSLSKTS